MRERKGNAEIADNLTFLSLSPGRGRPSKWIFTKL